MSFNVLASIAANDAASNASSSGTPIGVKILIGAFVVVIMLVGAWLAVLQQMRRQKWAESHGFRYIKADANLGKATRHVFGLAGRRHVARDVVVIPAGAKHWHGAKADSWFSHIAVEVPGEETGTEWLEPVSDAEYAALTEADS